MRGATPGAGRSAPPPPGIARRRPSARDLAFGGLFGAAALLLPTLFHVLQLGHAFMPMYLPLVALAFLVSPRTAATTGALVPLVSGIVTGMPPLYPPIAVIMAVEIGVICLLIGSLRRRGSWRGVFVPLLAGLLAGRLVNYGLTYLAAVLLQLPAGFVAGLSFIAGWPGILLMLAVIPPLVRIVESTGGGASELR